jgi:hypothetical protein
MKNFAKLNENNIVENVIVADLTWIDEQVNKTQYVEYLESNPAIIGGEFIDGFFYDIKPYDSWVKNDGKWIPPKPMPLNDKNYEWNDSTQEWVEKPFAVWNETTQEWTEV